MIYVLGSLNADLVIRAPRIPRPGETVLGEDLATFAGGKGANQAVAAAKLGADVRMIGEAGDDAHGMLLRESLRAAGVDDSGVGTSERPTGMAAITVDHHGENAIVVSPGANSALTPAMACERLAGIADGDVLLGPLETPLETVAAAFAFAKARGATTILNPAPAPDALPDRLLAAIDWLTPNEQEQARLAVGMSTQGMNVAVTLGADGCRLYVAGQSEQVAAYRVQPIDTTAAGDAWNGAFALALQQGREPPAAARWANAAAALSTTRSGAQSSAPTAHEVAAFLEREGA